jgi:hypothetical protein
MFTRYCCDSTLPTSTPIIYIVLECPPSVATKTKSSFSSKNVMKHSLILTIPGFQTWLEDLVEFSLFNKEYGQNVAMKIDVTNVDETCRRYLFPIFTLKMRSRRAASPDKINQ